MNADIFAALAKYIIRPIIICAAVVIAIAIVSNKAERFIPVSPTDSSIYTNYTRVVEIVVTNTVFGADPWILQKTP